MAKLFYTLEETSAKLAKDEGEITQLVSEGRLREFRDHDNKLMFKREEVDLLSADSAGSVELDLSGAPAGSDSFELDLSDSSLDARAGTGRSESPVGLGAVEDAKDEMTLELDLGESGAGAAPAAKVPELDLDLDLGGDAPKPIDDEPLGLDLDDAPATSSRSGKSASASMSAIAPAGGAEEMTLELDLGDDAPAPRAPAPKMNDSIGSMAAASAAGASGSQLGLDGSNAAAAASEGSSIADRIGVDGMSSGSGLMDLTNDSESSTIGAALMDEAFSSDEGAELPANASGIFGGESGEGAESGAGLAAAAVAVAATTATSGKKASAPIFTSGPAAPEAYSGSWSGLGVGLLLPASLGLLAAAATVIARQLGAPPDLAVMFAKDWMMYTGAFAGVILVSGAIGFFVGKATE
jgi:hypothetical protein